MKILMPTLYSNSRGGSVKILLIAAEELKKEHQVTIRANLDEADEKTNFSMPDILDSSAKKIKALFIMVKAVIFETLYLRKEKVDLIYVHDELALYVYGIVAKLIGCKTVWHLHAQEGDNINWFFRNHLSDFKIYISKHSQKRFYDTSYIVYNPLLVNRGQITIREDLNGILNISVIGSISDNKNQQLGLEIVKKLKEISNLRFCLNLYGYASNESYMKKMNDYIDRNSLWDDVAFHGYTDKQVIYDNTDIVLSTSKFESFGLVLIEAFSRGIPVVARNIDSYREIFSLIEYDDGMLFLSVEEACQAILKAINFDMEPYAKNVEKVFSLDRFSIELRRIFKEIESNEN